MRAWFPSIRDSVLILAAAGLAGPGFACGPWFPNRVLVDGESTLLQAPRATFALEIARILEGRSPSAPLPAGTVPAAAGAARELAALEAALAAGGRPEAERRALIGAWEELRRAIAAAALPAASWKAGLARDGAGALQGLSVPAGLPAEFDDYIPGAILYHQGEFGQARAWWECLLSRLAGERLHLSVAASFMIGKTWLEASPERAVARFRTARGLAALGFEDPHGLAAESVGWEAMAEMERKDYVRAAALYLDERAMPGARISSSLWLLASRALREGPETLRAIAADADGRAVVTARLLSLTVWAEKDPARGEKEKMDAWLEAVEAAVPGAVGGADRLAWLAYRGGDFDAARRWAGLAPEDAGLALWIRAKLALRAGRIAEGADLLARVVPAFPADQEWPSLSIFGDGSAYGAQSPSERARGELGAIQLARRQYAEALDTLLEAGYWLDAAYVAERILTLEELRAHVDRRFPDPAPEGWRGAEIDPLQLAPADPPLFLRYLLARRLARAGRLAEARPYLPDRQRSLLDDYARALEEGRDRKRPDLERAEAIWRAALIVRNEGRDLLATEVEPDWRGGGSPSRGPTGGRREKTGTADALRVTPDEAKRIAAHRTDPDDTAHYRYAAADLGWKAASLLPDGEDRTSRILCISGLWLAPRDPKAADRFYKALVRRCRKTDLGAEADRLRWFPRGAIDEEW